MLRRAYHICGWSIALVLFIVPFSRLLQWGYRAWDGEPAIICHTALRCLFYQTNRFDAEIPQHVITQFYVHTGLAALFETATLFAWLLTVIYPVWFILGLAYSHRIPDDWTWGKYLRFTVGSMILSGLCVAAAAFWLIARANTN